MSSAVANPTRSVSHDTAQQAHRRATRHSIGRFPINFIRFASLPSYPLLVLPVLLGAPLFGVMFAAGYLTIAYSVLACVADFDDTNQESGARYFLRAVVAFFVCFTLFAYLYS